MNTLLFCLSTLLFAEQNIEDPTLVNGSEKYFIFLESSVEKTKRTNIHEELVAYFNQENIEKKFSSLTLKNKRQRITLIRSFTSFAEAKEFSSRLPLFDWVVSTRILSQSEYQDYIKST